MATGRSVGSVDKAVGAHERLLVLPLDITDLAQAESAVEAEVERFGRIDVLVNNAGNFIAGFFESSRPPRCRRRSARCCSGR